MKKTQTAAIVAAPTHIDVRTTDLAIATNLRVVDGGTGETIDGVIEADASAGKLRRYATEDGNLVRVGDSYKIIDEDRAVRIEWIEPPVADDVDADAAAAGEGAA